MHNSIRKDKPEHKDTMSYSLIEKIVSRYPFPYGERSFFFRLLNMLFISCILPVVGYIYVYLKSEEIIEVESMPFYLPIEIFVVWIIIFLFAYTYLVDYDSQKVKITFSQITFLDLDEEECNAFKEDSPKKILNPHYIYLILFVSVLTGGEFFALSISNAYTGDIIVTILIVLMIIYANMLTGIGLWMFYIMFLKISRKFGREIALKIDPFNKDEMGGILPIVDLNTLALLSVGIIAALVVPLWYLFSVQVAGFFAILTCVLIPCVFFYSMNGVRKELVKTKRHLLDELNDEFSWISKNVRNYITQDHAHNLNIEEVNGLSRGLTSLDIIYRRINSMRTFTLKAEIITKVIGSMVLPLITFIIPLVLEYLTK